MHSFRWPMLAWLPKVHRQRSRTGWTRAISRSSAPSRRGLLSLSGWLFEAPWPGQGSVRLKGGVRRPCTFKANAVSQWRDGVA